LKLRPAIEFVNDKKRIASLLTDDKKAASRIAKFRKRTETNVDIFMNRTCGRFLLM